METPQAVLLMTRPLLAAARFVDQLPPSVRSRVLVCYAPLLEISPTPDPIKIKGIQGLIFTSAAGVTAVAAALGETDLPCFCVGTGTGKAVQDLGWTLAHVSPTAKALIAALIDIGPAAPMLHLSGRHTRGDIAQTLTQAGIETRSQVTYDQHLCALDLQALTYLQGDLPVIAPLFSPRTARHFALQAHGSAPLWLGALSPSVAEPLADMAKMAISVADAPDAESMCDVVEKLLNLAVRVETRGPAH